MSVADPAAPSGNVGRAMRRKEDPALITGKGRYVDDIALPAMLWASFVRSPEAHAKIVSIDTSAATQRPGIQAVFTGEDMADIAGPLPMAWAPPGVHVSNPPHWPLARGEVNHVGDPVAIVIGEDRYAVSDAVDDVIVEYQPLPGGDVDVGFAEADVIVERRVINHRIAGAPIECRGVIADYRAGSLTLYT